jgi:hypothetical protein
MLTRRRLTWMLAALVVVGAGGLVGANPAITKAGSEAVSLEGPLTRDVFRALEREEFSVLLTNRPATLVLVRVDDVGASPDGREFVVVFEGAPDLRLGEGTYRVTHASAGTTDLYLRPTRVANGHSYYEAPFSLVPAGVQGSAPVRELKRYERPLYEPPRR